VYVQALPAELLQLQLFVACLHAFAYCCMRCCTSQNCSLACVLAGGRYLQDLWVYNLNRLQWTAPAAEQQPDAAEGGEEEGAALLAPAGPPASAGWSVTPFQDKLLVLGGHVKAGKVCKDSSIDKDRYLTTPAAIDMLCMKASLVWLQQQDT
jgi:hypothetical protein